MVTLIFQIWIASVVGTCVIANSKKLLTMLWFLLSLILGPVAVLIVLLVPKNEQVSAGPSGQHPEYSLNSIKAELEGLKNEFSALSAKLNNLAVKISSFEVGGAKIPAAGPQAPAAAPAPVPLQSPKEGLPAVPAAEKPPARKSDIEMDLGKFWLNKIGMAVFSLGVAFLLTYTIARVGAPAKILLGYLIAVALFISGVKLESSAKFANYGRVLLGGGWAIAYFTTYAMSFFEASRIIDNQLLGLSLLAVVAFGIIAHSLRYRSEALTAMALFIGYFTSVLGSVGYFTLINAALLAAVALVVVYKMQWVRFIFLGIILTYLTHFAWVIKQISLHQFSAGRYSGVESVYFLFDAGFLAIYWALFTLAAHIIKDKKDAKRLAAANFANFILFFFMAFPKFYLFYPAYKFNAVLGLGLVYMAIAAVMELSKRSELFISDIVIAVSLLTLSVPLKFLPYHTDIIWFIELPFLVFVGLVFERRVYRYLAFALSMVLFLKCMFWEWGLLGNSQFFTFSVSWRAVLCFAGFVSAAAVFCLYRFLGAKEGISANEKPLRNLYSAFSVAYLTVYLWEAANPSWLTLGLSLESLLVFALGALLLDKYIRWYALAVLALAGLRFCIFDPYFGAAGAPRALFVYGPAACGLVEYFIYRILGRKSLIADEEGWVSKVLFFAAASLLVFAIVTYGKDAWITLEVAIVAVLALFWGAGALDKHIRLYSLLVLFFAAARFVSVDTYSGIGMFFKWPLICAKLACAYAAYFIYRMLNKRSLLDEPEKPLATLLFYASALLTVLVIFKHIEDIWVAVALGVVGVLLFATGFLIKEKIFRHGGFIIFGITLARVVFIDLAGLAMVYKIISFTVLGLLFLGVSFIYTKYAAEKP